MIDIPAICKQLGYTTRREMLIDLKEKYNRVLEIADIMGVSNNTAKKWIRDENLSLDFAYYICEICGEKTPRGKHEGKKKVCNKPECQSKLKEKIIFNARKRSRYAKRQLIEKRKEHANKPIKHKRVCRLCGQDPKPNYLYCPTCYSSIQYKTGGLDDIYL